MARVEWGNSDSNEKGNIIGTSVDSFGNIWCVVMCDDGKIRKVDSNDVSQLNIG